MNGKRAKLLAKMARMLCQQEGIKWGEGYNQYNQLENYVVWEPAYQDGKPHDWANPDNNTGRLRMVDPDGRPLLAPAKKPGTIYTAWKYRMIYQNLKRLWKQTNGKNPIFEMLKFISAH